MNTFAYVGGDPMRHLDPRGLEAVSEMGGMDWQYDPVEGPQRKCAWVFVTWKPQTQLMLTDTSTARRIARAQDAGDTENGNRATSAQIERSMTLT